MKLSFVPRLPSLTIAITIAVTAALFAPPAFSRPYGTSYTASVENLPGTAAALLLFDGLATPLGGSGLIVGEKSTSFGSYELVEFSLRTADGEPFVGQQLASTEVASVGISGLHWLDDSSPTTALRDSGFLWLTIDGVPQTLSDFANLELRFGTHPLDPSVPVVFIANSSNAALQFDTGGRAALESLGALVGPIAALQVDGIHLAVAAAPVPEPGFALSVVVGAFGLLTFALRQRRFREKRVLQERPLRPRPSTRFRMMVSALVCLCLPGYYTGCDAEEDSGGVFTSEPKYRPPLSSYFDPAGPGSIETKCLDIDGNVVVNCHSGGAVNWDCVTVTPDPGQTFLGWLPFGDYPCNVQVSGPPPGCDGADQFLFTGAYAQRCVAAFCETARLDISIDGAGLTGSNPAGVSCTGETCTGYFCTGTVVTLNPQPRAGSGMVLTGWSGDADCADGTVQMSASRSCVAHFRQPLFTAAVTGSGTVSSNRISCQQGSPPEVCEAAVAQGTTQQFYATPEPGATFVGWGGDCSGSGSETVASTQVTGDVNCTANFTTLPGHGVTEIVSLADDESLLAGGVLPTVDGLDASADLSVVSFVSESRNGLARNRTLGTTREIRPPNPGAFFGVEPISLSADGRFAAYQYQEEVSPGNPMPQIYLRDLVSQPAAPPERISLHDPLTGIGSDPDGGGQLANVSGNGRYVVYLGVIPFMRDDPGSGESGGVVVHDTCVGAPPAEACTPGPVAVSYDELTDEAHSPGFPNTAPRISRDGRVVLYHAFSNSLGMDALFLHDRDADADGVYDEPAATSTVPVVTGLDGSFGPFFLDASGRYVGFRSADPTLPNNANPPPSGRAFLHDTCFEAPGACTPSDTLLFWQSNGVPDYQPLSFAGGAYFDFQTQLTDVSGSGRFVAFESEDRRYYNANTTGWTFGRLGFMRDTCIGAPPLPVCVPTNRLVSRRTNGVEVPLAEKVVRTADDGSHAVIFGQRSNIVSQPNGTLFEVLLSVTGFAPASTAAPSVSALIPLAVPAGSPELLLTIRGSGFEPGVRILWNGEPESREAIYISSTKLQLRLLATDLASPGAPTFQVINPIGPPSDPPVSFSISVN